MSLTEQTSIYDVERQPLMDLDKGLVRIDERVIAACQTHISIQGFPALAECGLPDDAIVPYVPPVVPVAIPPGMNPVQRKAYVKELLDGLPTRIVRSRHLRWTTEHAVDVQRGLQPLIGVSH